MSATTAVPAETTAPLLDPPAAIGADPDRALRDRKGKKHKDKAASAQDSDSAASPPRAASESPKPRKLSLTVTADDLARIEAMKASARAVDFRARKTDIVRAAVQIAATLPTGRLVRALQDLPAVHRKRK